MRQRGSFRSPLDTMSEHLLRIASDMWCVCVCMTRMCELAFVANSVTKHFSHLCVCVCVLFWGFSHPLCCSAQTRADTGSSTMSNAYTSIKCFFSSKVSSEFFLSVLRVVNATVKRTFITRCLYSLKQVATRENSEQLLPQQTDFKCFPPSSAFLDVPVE